MNLQPATLHKGRKAMSNGTKKRRKMRVLRDTDYESSNAYIRCMILF